MPRKRFIAAPLGAILFLCLPGTIRAQAVSSATGFVKDASGNPAPEVFVSASRITSPQTVVRATTKTNGAFSLAGIKAGTYRLCIQSAGQIYLDPCEWSRTPREFTVKGDGTASDLGTITVAKGTPITVHIDDPTQTLQATAATALSASLPHVVLGVMTPGGAFRPAVITAKTAISRDHTVTIPADTPVQLIVTPHQVTLADAKGTPVAATGTTVPLMHASSNPNAEPAVIFKITGQAH